MALSKEIINEIGIKTTYHRINSMTKKNDVLEVWVASYTDETYRKREEEVKETLSNLNVLVKERDILENNTSRTAQEEVEYRELKKKIDDAVSNADTYFVACENMVKINKPEIAHISFEDVYAYLKTIEPYKNAKDC